MSGRDTGGVAIAFLGFVALTMAFRGTWANVWHALVREKGTPSGAGGVGGGDFSPGRGGGDFGGGDFPQVPGSGAGSGRPGAAPSPLAGSRGTWT